MKPLSPNSDVLPISAGRLAMGVGLACALAIGSGCSDDPAPGADGGGDAAADLSTADLAAATDSGAGEDASADTSTADSGFTPDLPPVDAALPTDIFPTLDAPAGCGNGTREATEQCDDGNNKNLDGCDSLCRYEHDQRINYLKMQFSSDSFCTKNAFGKAITLALARTALQQTIDGSIKDGTITLLMKYFGLDDLSGASDPALKIGVLAGSPVKKTGYDGTSDLDWWYKPAAGSIDTNRNPIAALDASITSNALTVLRGSLPLRLNLAGTRANFKLVGIKLSATNAAPSKPLSSSGSTPGHLASEHLDPKLTSFPRSGQPTSSGAGKMCGNITAASLAKVSVPALLAGPLGCTEGYTSTGNSMLDVVIGGCTTLLGKAINKTQPDGDDPAVSPAGGGPPYKLTANASTKKVTGCTDKGGKSVSLSACLADATYSAFFRFATGRVIIK